MHKPYKYTVGKSVKNTNEIRAYIKTRAFLGRGLKDIYAYICAVYETNEIFFSTVCRWVRTCSIGVESKSKSSPMSVEKKIKQIVKSDAR